MVVWFIESFVHRHGGTVVLGPTHIGGDPSKRQVDLRIRIGDLCADGDVHIHNPTSGNNTSKTPLAVVKRAAQLKKDKYAASSSKDGFEFFSMGAEDTGSMDPEFREFAIRLARVCARQNPTLRVSDVLQEFVAGVIRTIHKGNEIIVRTADLRSMDAKDPAERMPRQQRRVREAAFQDVVEQVHQDQQQREQQQERSRRGGNQTLQPPPASQTSQPKTSKLNRRGRQPTPTSSSSAQHPKQRGSLQQQANLKQAATSRQPQGRHHQPSKQPAPNSTEQGQARSRQAKQQRAIPIPTAAHIQRGDGGADWDLAAASTGHSRRRQVATCDVGEQAASSRTSPSAPTRGWSGSGRRLLHKKKRQTPDVEPPSDADGRPPVHPATRRR